MKKNMKRWTTFLMSLIMLMQSVQLPVGHIPSYAATVSESNQESVLAPDAEEQDTTADDYEVSAVFVEDPTAGIQSPEDGLAISADNTTEAALTETEKSDSVEMEEASDSENTEETQAPETSDHDAADPDMIEEQPSEGMEETDASDELSESLAVSEITGAETVSDEMVTDSPTDEEAEHPATAEEPAEDSETIETGVSYLYETEVNGFYVSISGDSGVFGENSETAVYPLGFLNGKPIWDIAVEGTEDDQQLVDAAAFDVSITEAGEPVVLQTSSDVSVAFSDDFKAKVQDCNLPLLRVYKIDKDGSMQDVSFEIIGDNDGISFLMISGGTYMVVLAEGLPMTTMGDGDVSRAEWLHRVVETCGLVSDESAVPDNYFTDLSSSHTYYQDILTAVYYGLVDAPAGTELHPDNPASRIFAVHALNKALGLYAEENHSFSDAAEINVDYLNDAYVALEQGWIIVAEGQAFQPTLALTSDEADRMTESAAGIIEERNKPTSAEDFTFVSGVIVVPKGTEVDKLNQFDDDMNLVSSTVTIMDLPEGITIQKNDLFVVYLGDIPVGLKALSVSTNGRETVISCESAEVSDIFVSGAASGTFSVDMNEIQPAENTEVLWYNEETGLTYESLDDFPYETGALPIKDFHQVIDLGDGAELVVDMRLKDDPVIDWGCDIWAGNYYFKTDLTTVLDVSLNVDVNKASGLNLPTLTLAYVPIAGVGYIKLEEVMTAKGAVKATKETPHSIYLGYQRFNGAQITNEITPKPIAVTAKGEFDIGVKLSAGVCDLPGFKANAWANTGINASILYSKYNDGNKPEYCLNTSAYLYANMGALLKVEFLGNEIVNKNIKQVIYDINNSPIRVSHHEEDGVEVSYCSRQSDPDSPGFGFNGSGFTTKAGSQWLSINYGLTNGNYALDDQGTPVQIYTYKLDDDDNAIITGFNGNASALIIPEELDGHVVVEIGAEAFLGEKGIKSVIIPDTITCIRNKAFQNCIRLERVEIPDTVTRIDSYAFASCSSLSEVVLPKSLTTLGYNTVSAYSGHVFANTAIEEITIPKSLERAYQGCFRNTKLKQVSFEDGITTIPTELFSLADSLEEITIPDTVTVIGAEAFRHATSLKSVSLPENLLEIRGSAFEGCESLAIVQIPDTVTDIDSSAFKDCTSLCEVNLPKSLTKLGYNSIGAYAGQVFVNTAIEEITIPKSLERAYQSCFRNTKLKQVGFEDGITAIPAELFSGADSIEEIIIPDTVTVIGAEAFKNAVSLKNVSLFENLLEIGSDAFKGCKSLVSIQLPDSITAIKSSAFADCTALREVNLPKALSSLGYNGTSAYAGHAFANTAIEEITIPKALKTVYKACFSGAKLKKVYFEEGIEIIPSELFSYADSLEDIDIPDTVTKIEYKAFYQATALKHINLHDGLAELEESVFTGCTAIEEIIIPDTVTSMGSWEFSECTNLKKVHLPSCRKNITTGMFSKCTNLSEVNLPDTLETIQGSAFAECHALTEVNVPSNLNEISSYAFENCDGLVTVTINTDVGITIGNNAFYDCDKLESVVLGDKVTSIGSNCFQKCDELSNVELGIGIKKIPDYAFADCGKLGKIIIPYYVTSIGNNAFANDPMLTEVTIPQATTSIGSNVFSYPAKMTIYGVSGSYAETYANANSIKFVDMTVPVESITFADAEISLIPGATKVLTPTILPNNFTDLLEWKSAASSIVSVDDNGKITAKAVGTTTIRLTAESGVVGKITVNVVQPVTSISVSPYSKTLGGGETVQLTATVNPSTAANRDYVWSSTDESIATVSETGLVTAYKKGSCSIRATALDGSGKYGSCSITVSNNYYEANDIADLQSPHPYANECTDIWGYKLAGSQNLQITFSEDTETEEDADYIIITDKNGSVVGKYSGAALAGTTVTVPGDAVRIQLVSDSSKFANRYYGFRVTDVKAGQAVSVTGITLDRTGIVEVNTNDSITVTATVLPENAANKKVIWKSSKENVATVTVDGTGATCIVKALTYGTATITATTDDGGYTASFTVQTRFYDVTNSSRYWFKPVYWAADAGITKGYGGVYFGPEENCTREQMITFLYRQAGSPNISSADMQKYNKFSDVPQNAYYAKAVAWAAKNGITNGYSSGPHKGKFGVGLQVTREDTVTFLYRAAGKPAVSTTDIKKYSFPDVASSKYYAKAIVWAAKNGVTKGYSSGAYAGKFGVGLNVLRKDLITFLYRYNNL